MVKIVRQVVREETFSFTPSDGGPEIVILSGQLRQFLLSRAAHLVTKLIFPVQPLEELIVNHGLEADRMASMTILEASEPVIVGILNSGTNILIDGAHRRWFWAKRGQNTIRGWAVSEEIWRHFEIDPKTFPGFVAHMPDGSLLPQRSKK